MLAGNLCLETVEFCQDEELDQGISVMVRVVSCVQTPCFIAHKHAVCAMEVVPPVEA